MLEFIGKGKSHNSNGTTRRDFLRVGALGGLGMTLERANENSTRGLENCRVLKFDRQTKLRSSGQKATT